jgi:hypothetical protein
MYKERKSKLQQAAYPGHAGCMMFLLYPMTKHGQIMNKVPFPPFK